MSLRIFLKTSLERNLILGGRSCCTTYIAACSIGFPMNIPIVPTGCYGETL